MKAIPAGHLLCHYLYAFFVHCVLAQPYAMPLHCMCILLDSNKKVIAYKIRPFSIKPDISG
jgi:hypothetical protein